MVSIENNYAQIYIKTKAIQTRLLQFIVDFEFFI